MPHHGYQHRKSKLFFQGLMLCALGILTLSACAKKTPPPNPTSPATINQQQRIDPAADAATADVVVQEEHDKTVTYTLSSAVTVWSGSDRNNAQARIVKVVYTIASPSRGTHQYCGYVSFIYEENGKIGIPHAFANRRCVESIDNEKNIVDWIARLNFGTANLVAGGEACENASWAALHASAQDGHITEPSLPGCIQYPSPVPIHVVSSRDVSTPAGEFTLFEVSFAFGNPTQKLWVTPVDTE